MNTATNADEVNSEREALAEFLFTVYEHGTQPNALKEADAILRFLAGFRRTEPHCNHCGRPLCATLKPGEFCACECHPPQDEPSDAMVKAACEEYAAISFQRRVPQAYMRSALRAAQEAQ